MGVTSSSQGTIALSAAGVALAGHAGPVVDRFTQPWAAGTPHYDLGARTTAFAAALGDGSDTAQSAQGVIITFAQRL